MSTGPVGTGPPPAAMAPQVEHLEAQRYMTMLLPDWSVMVAWMLV
jgi:hypothetical protein